MPSTEEKEKAGKAGKLSFLVGSPRQAFEHARRQAGAMAAAWEADNAVFASLAPAPAPQKAAQMGQEAQGSQEAALSVDKRAPAPKRLPKR